MQFYIDFLKMYVFDKTIVLLFWTEKMWHTKIVLFLLI